MKLEEIAREIGAEVVFPPDDKVSRTLEFDNISDVYSARPNQLTFLAADKHLEAAKTTKAGALIVTKVLPEIKKPQLIHKNPYSALGRCSQLFNPTTIRETISKQAVIAKCAQIGDGVSIRPLAVVSEGAVIGNRVTLYPHCFIGENVIIGDDTVIHPNVTIMAGSRIGARNIIHANSTVGADGFGFAPDENEIVKIPQVGVVVTEDDVEIGACTSIDRATFNETRIRRGTKIDSHVHIGHNCDVGENSMLCGMVGMAGSVTTGKSFIAAGQVGIGQGVKIADGVTIASKGGVTKDVEKAGIYAGTPLQKQSEWRRSTVGFLKLPQLIKRLQKVEETLASLMEKRK